MKYIGWVLDQCHLFFSFSKMCSWFLGSAIVWVQIWDLRKVFKRIFCEDFGKLCAQSGDKLQYSDNLCISVACVLVAVFQLLCFGRLHSDLSNHRELHGTIFQMM